MKKFKGTPGPWINVGGWVDAENNGVICSLSSVDRKPEEVSDANAQLISSSPDLLSALQRLLEIYDDQSGKVWTTSSKRRALDNARAAVNKALGETK